MAIALLYGQGSHTVQCLPQNKDWLKLGMNPVLLCTFSSRRGSADARPKTLARMFGAACPREMPSASPSSPRTPELSFSHVDL